MLIAVFSIKLGDQKDAILRLKRIEHPLDILIHLKAIVKEEIVGRDRDTFEIRVINLGYSGGDNNRLWLLYLEFTR